MQKAMDRIEQKATLAILGVALILFLAMAWLQYFTFAIPAVDFSIFDQMIPNTARGRFMVSAACGNCDHFGVHSTPILFLLYPFHLLFNHPLFLVSVHAIALWSAAIPLVLLCRRKLDVSWHRTAVLIAFFCSPFFIKILDYQFHPEVFYVPLFLWFGYFLDRGRRGALWVVSLLLLSVKEDAAIYLAAAALGAGLSRKMRWSDVFGLVGVSILVFWINLRWVIPANSVTGEYRLAATSARFGNSLVEAILGMLRNWSAVLLDLLKGAWLRELFRFLFLPLFQPLFLIAIAPFALIHSISEAHVMRGLALYYSAPYLPWVFIGYVLALSRPKLPPRFRSFALAFAVLTSAPAWYPRHLPSAESVESRNEGWKAVRGRIDVTKTICAQGSIFPHLGYAEKIGVLGKSCDLASKSDAYLLSASLDAFPLSSDAIEGAMHQLESDPAYQKQVSGEFTAYFKREAKN